MSDETKYDEWIARRRSVEPSSELIDRVMASVEDRNVLFKRDVRLADRMNESPAVRRTACAAALLVGNLPFLMVAYVAKLLVF